MNQLPFLMVHGDLVWKVLLAITLIGLYALIWRRRRRRIARRRARLFREATPRERFSEGAEVAVTGVLRAGGDRCESYEAGKEVAAATALVADDPNRAHRRRAGELYVEGAEVEIAGPVEVAVGSREVRRGLSKPNGELAKQLAIAPRELPNLVEMRSIKEGARVLARGRLRSQASRQGTSFREGALAWRLEPAEDGGAVQLGFTGRTRVPLVLPVYGLAAGAALFLFLAFVVGKASLPDAPRGDWDRPRTHDARLASATGWRLALAAATPFHRDEALDQAYPMVHPGGGPAPSRILETGAALDELRGGCDVDLLLHFRAFDLALSRIDQCEDEPRQVGLKAAALAARGDYQRASRVLRESEALPEVASVMNDVLVPGLLARDYLAVAEGLRELDPVTAEICGGDTCRSAEAVACLEEALRARAGEEAALGRLRNLAGADAPSACSLLLADLLEGEERRRLLASRPHLAEDVSDPHLVHLLAAEAGMELEPLPAHGLRFIPLGDFREPFPPSLGSPPVAAGLDRAVYHDLEGSDGPAANDLRARAAWRLANALALTGDFETARRRIEDALRLARAGSGNEELIADLRRANRAWRREGRRATIVLPREVEKTELERLQDSETRDILVLRPPQELALEQLSDGRPIQRKRLAHSDIELATLTRYVAAGGDVPDPQILAASVRGLPTIQFFRFMSVFPALHALRMRLYLADALEDREEAARLRAHGARVREAWLRREIAIPLYVLKKLHWM